ncbi:MAG: hypothetical protein IT342_27355 [Candidatus Melainabacteria bacterium]|nr:hypothetical protein [Candidatus Melainabacteria bacterium]
MECCEYLIAALSGWPVDPALVNEILIAIVMSEARLDVAEWMIVKCPLG